MITHPFELFRPYADRFDVRFLTKEDTLRTDEDLAEAIGSSRIASLRQTHGGRSILAREAMNRAEHADATATDEKGLWLSIRAADCQQLVVYAPDAYVCAVIHAGWKGLKAGIIPSLFALLKDEWGIRPADTLVGIGPSLCADCAEFTDPAAELAEFDPRFFHGRNADLQGIADWQLETLGIPLERRERHPGCTRCEADVFWTYRGGDREKVQSGHTNVIACSLG